jgi:DNA-binding XRE family transcriptional regulator
MNAEWFAGRMKELREQAGLTQQQLADKAGLKIGGVRDLEQGRRSPAWETVLAVAGALGVEVTAFTEPPLKSQTPRQRGRPRKGPPADVSSLTDAITAAVNGYTARRPGVTPAIIRSALQNAANAFGRANASKGS